MKPHTPEKKMLHNPTDDEMPRTADTVVIGGGMIGPAIMWALEESEPNINAVLIEKNDQLASGASIASIENFRTDWPAPCLANMMMRSAEIFLHADEYLGDGAQNALQINQRGYIYLAFSDQDACKLQREVEHLHGIGVDHAQFLSASDVRARYPWLGENVAAAKFDPIAGNLDSNALAYLFVKKTKKAKYLTGISHTKIIVENGKVVGVVTPNGTINTNNVVIAAGAGSKAVGETAGITIPIVVRPRQSFTTPWRDESIPADAPFVIGSKPYPYFRPEASTGAIFGWEYYWRNKYTEEGSQNPADHLQYPIWPINNLIDARFPSVLLAVLAKQFGHDYNEGFFDSRYLRGVRQKIGYYVSRDPNTTIKTNGAHNSHYDSQRAIIDAHPEIEGLYLSVAHVGHGIMSAPAAGEIMAAHVLGQEQSDPLFYQFGINVSFVEHDAGGL